MRAHRVEFEKGWWTKEALTLKSRERTSTLIKQAKITKAEDLPELLSAKEAARYLKVHYKTAADMMKSGIVTSKKIGGRRYTTPQWIADYLERGA